jgi:hypothetical protein
LALWRLRSRALLGAVAGVVAVAAFCVLAAAGLSILTRYLLLPACVLAIFCGAGVFGWRVLPAGDAWRARWMAFGALTVLLLVAFAPSQLDRLRSTRGALVTQTRILDELHDLSVRLPPPPNAVTVPNRRAVPQLALWTDRRPAQVLSAQERGRYTPPAFVPVSPRVAAQFVLDRRDLDRSLPAPPPGGRPVRGRYWLLYP